MRHFLCLTPVALGITNSTDIFVKPLSIKELNNLESVIFVEISYLYAAVRDEAAVFR